MDRIAILVLLSSYKSNAIRFDEQQFAFAVNHLHINEIMNHFGVLVLALAIATASAQPQFRARFVSQRQLVDTTTELESTTVNEAPYAAAGFTPDQEFNLPSKTDATVTEPEEGPEETTGPYAPSGWQPSGQLLNLPSVRQRQLQQPRLVYGQPDATTTEEYDTTTTSVASSEFESNETTDEPDSELLPNSALLSAKVTNAKLQQLRNQKLTQETAAQNQQGAYYVQLADGSVQPVVYYQFPTNAAGGLVSARLQVQPQRSAVVPVAQQPAVNLLQATRSAAFVQASPLVQPQYYINPYVIPNAVSYSSQYQSSW